MGIKNSKSEYFSFNNFISYGTFSEALKFVPRIFLLKYGWPHKEAETRYPKNEMSFRQTIGGKNRSDRGFKIVINRSERKVLVSFNSNKVAEYHSDWIASVNKRISLDEINPQPYWGFDDLFHKAGTKLINCFYAQAQVKKKDGEEYFHYNKILMLQKFSIDKFVKALEENEALVDFDARTGHNHGTKFRLRQDHLPELYEKITEI